jgi:hypothetical protein
MKNKAKEKWGQVTKIILFDQLEPLKQRGEMHSILVCDQ